MKVQKQDIGLVYVSAEDGTIEVLNLGNKSLTPVTKNMARKLIPIGSKIHFRFQKPCNSRMILEGVEVESVNDDGSINIKWKSEKFE